MDNFIEREDIENLPFRHLMPTYLEGHKGFIAGGCFKNLLNDEDVKDFDVYFHNEQDWAEAKEYYTKNDKYTFVYENEKVVAYRNKYSKRRVELVRALFGTPQEIINEFDFTITKFAYYTETERIAVPDEGEPEEVLVHRFVHHKDFFEHLHMKRLVIDNKIIRPGSTYERTYKYQKYGYGLCRESKVKVIEALRSDSFTPDDLSASLYDGLD